jgi:hypothetical protein
MAKRISQLPEETAVAVGDQLPLYDVSTGTTKRATVTNLLAGVTDGTLMENQSILAKHVDLSFADASARDAAIPSPWEGCLIYRSDLDAIETYDGSAWLTIDNKWQSYTPTLTNLTAGNGTLNAKYMRQGKKCTVRFVFTFGTTSSMGTDPTLTLPFTAVALAAGANIMQEGVCALFDSSGSTYFYGYFAATSTTTRTIRTANVAGTYPSAAQITSAVPMTWANLDQIAGQFTYDVA